MSGFDDLNYTTVNVGATQVDGTATALPQYLATTGTHYKCDVTRVTLSGSGSGTTAASANLEPKFGATGGSDYLVVCNNTAALFVDLPPYEKSALGEVTSVANHPLRGRRIEIQAQLTTASNTITVTAVNQTTTTSTFADTTIGGSATFTLVSAAGTHGAVFMHDGLQWNVVSSY